MHTHAVVSTCIAYVEQIKVRWTNGGWGILCAMETLVLVVWYFTGGAGRLPALLLSVGWGVNKEGSKGGRVGAVEVS